MSIFLFASFLKQGRSRRLALVSGFVRPIRITNEQADEQRKQGWNPNKGPSHPGRAQYISAMVQKPIETTLWLKTYGAINPRFAGAMGSSSWTATLPWLHQAQPTRPSWSRDTELSNVHPYCYYSTNFSLPVVYHGDFSSLFSKKMMDGSIVTYYEYIQRVPLIDSMHHLTNCNNCSDTVQHVPVVWCYGNGKQMVCLNSCIICHNLTLGMPHFIRQVFRY
jgi:hypothetical protein